MLRHQDGRELGTVLGSAGSYIRVGAYGGERCSRWEINLNFSVVFVSLSPMYLWIESHELNTPAVKTETHVLPHPVRFSYLPQSTVILNSSDSYWTHKIQFLVIQLCCPQCHKSFQRPDSQNTKGVEVNEYRGAISVSSLYILFVSTDISCRYFVTKHLIKCISFCSLSENENVVGAGWFHTPKC